VEAVMVDPMNENDSAPIVEEPEQTLEELIAFIDAHGGQLGPFRGWRDAEKCAKSVP
jgi:hypothetical protein